MLNTQVLIYLTNTKIVESIAVQIVRRNKHKTNARSSSYDTIVVCSEIHSNIQHSIFVRYKAGTFLGTKIKATLTFH